MKRPPATAIGKTATGGARVTRISEPRHHRVSPSPIPHAAGLFHADDEHVTIHNRGGDGSAAALIFFDGRVELRRLGPGETITLSDEDSFTYVQAPPSSRRSSGDLRRGVGPPGVARCR